MAVDMACDFRTKLAMRNGGLYPARHVVEKCGGINATAELIGLDRSAVNRWLLPKERGGTGGQVPARHQPALLQKVPGLEPADFFQAPPQAAIEAAE